MKRKHVNAKYYKKTFEFTWLGSDYPIVQIGKLTTKLLIAFFACHNVTHSFISLGQLFHTLLASLRNVDCTIVDFPNSYNNTPFFSLDSVLIAQSCWMSAQAGMVERFCLNPCWLSGKSLLDSKYSETCSQTVFPEVLELHHWNPVWSDHRELSNLPHTFHLHLILTFNLKFDFNLFQLAFLPFGYTIDQYRWALFDGTANKEEMNYFWWQLR